jgi:SAM-dependent methyltransferase
MTGMVGTMTVVLDGMTSHRAGIIRTNRQRSLGPKKTGPTMLTPDATVRFSKRVDTYVRYRPGYPPEVVACLREFGLRPEHTVADVGSGTGVFSELLLKNGNTVYAVEPNAEMRAAADRLFTGNPLFHSVAAPAEATTLPSASVNWVTAAQAFHWFDVGRCRIEFARILRPGGRIALLWNNRREDTPFLADYEQFLRRHAIDYAAVKHQNVECDGRLERFFGPGGYARRSFANEQVFDFDGLRGRTLSSSYMPGDDHPGCAAILADLERIFRRHAVEGRVLFAYQTRMYVGRITG